MKKARYLIGFPVFATVLFLCASGVSHGQSREKYVISAKAGGINAVTGRATVHGRGDSEWQQLSIKDDLEAGDVVRTSLDGRVEMLLNPGSYMRIAENSEFELADNSLMNLEIRLLRGTAIVEATGADDTEMLINITTPHARMAIVRRGLYRVNVIPGDATELIVRKGRVLLADSQTKVKGGTKIIFSGTTFSMAKLEKADKKMVDNFEAWSKQRAETVAQANRKITGRDLNLLMTSFNDRWLRGFSARSSGFWLFNSRMGCYTFMPLFLGWGSPYGGTYSNSFYGGYYWGGRQLYGGSVVGNSPVGAVNGRSGSAGGSASNPPSISAQPPQRSPAQDRPSHASDQRIQRKMEPDRR